MLEGIVVVTKRNGENPSVRTSAFFLYFSPFFFTACCLPGSVKKEGEEVKGVGEEREPCLPFGVQVFPEPDGTCLELCCARCEKCLTWQGVK